MTQKLRVAFHPQLGGRNIRFLTYTETLPEAVAILNAIADYDNYLVKTKLRPDHSNAGYIEELENGEWLSWEGPDGEDDPEEYLRTNKG